MSERTETEIKAMTKEQNYFTGYSDAKSDVLNEIRAEIEDMDAPNCDFEGFYKCQSEVLQIIDKYKVESEG